MGKVSLLVATGANRPEPARIGPNWTGREESPLVEQTHNWRYLRGTGNRRSSLDAAVQACVHPAVQTWQRVSNFGVGGFETGRVTVIGVWDVELFGSRVE